MPKMMLGKPIDEEKWERAKELASEEGHAEDYAYITGIYKRMMGMSKSKIILSVRKSEADPYEDVRCKNCNALLFRMKRFGEYRPMIEIKCRKCGTLNNV